MDTWEILEVGMKCIATRLLCREALGLTGLLTGLLVGPHAAAQLASTPWKGQRSSASVVSYATGRSAPVFIENRGQFDSRVRFQVKVAGKVLWLTDKGIVFDIQKSRSVRSAGRTASPARGPASGRVSPPMNQAKDRLVFTENFIDSQEHPVIETKSPRAGSYNYLIGNDPANWHTNVHGYSEILYREVWPGIDVRISANGPDLEQEFVVRPGGDPRQIGVRYDGIDKLKVASDGSLAVQTAFGVLSESKPRIYQKLPGKTVAVRGRFVLSGDFTYTFAVDFWRPEYALVIDPTVLLYSTYLGGSSNDQGAAIAVDIRGNTYVGGYTISPDFPTTAGALSTTFPGTQPAGFVSKLDPAGIPVYSTFYSNDIRYQTIITGLAVNTAGQAYITGYVGAGEPFVTKLNIRGDKVLYSPCCLGNGVPQAIALDSSGNAYIAGTSSGGLTTTPDAYQPSNAGNGGGCCYSYGNDAFVVVLDQKGALRYSTYIGGIEDDTASAIAVDSHGDVYVGGVTSGPYFPTTPGAFQTVFEMGNYPCNNLSHEVCTSGWVAKLNPNVAGAAGLIYSTYLGGSGGKDNVTGIAVDRSGDMYAAGSTGSSDFPMTPKAFNPASECEGGFVTKFNPSGSGLIYSTCVTQGAGLYSLQGIALDAIGEAYVAGYAGGGTVPVTPDAFQGAAHYNVTNAFLVKLNAAGSEVVYGSYLGGSLGDVAHAVAVGPSGNAYLTGATSSLDFPVTPSAFQPNSGGACNGGCNDAFVTEFDLTGTGVAPVTLFPATTLDFGRVAVGETKARTVRLTNHENKQLNFTSIQPSAGFVIASNACGAGVAADAACKVEVTFAPAATGAATGNLTFTDGAANSPQTLTLTGTGVVPVTLFPATALDFGTVAVGETSTARTVTLINHENIRLNFSSIRTSAGFVVASNTCGADIAARANCKVDVTFSPAATGSAVGNLTFTDDAVGRPQSVRLMGTGSPPVTASPASLAFAAFAVGTTSVAKTVTLTNNLKTALSVSTVVANGDFVVDGNTCGAGIGAGLDCTVGVIFKPTVTGARSGTLTVNYGAFGSPLLVQLTGIGK
jgi:hypothetical protein